MIVDSCHDSTGKPAALAYLESIGVPPEHIILLVATHWHDDHVRGFSTLVEKSVNAEVCMSKAFTENEFVTFLSAYNKPFPTDRLPSGSSELLATLKILQERKSPATIAYPDRCLLRPPRAAPGVEIYSLSPSDACLERFMRYIGANMPQQGVTKTRTPSIKANETAIALLVKLQDHSILLGADLEETHKGWTAILASNGRPQELSTLFKIPHHGSENGHHDGVWDNMLIPSPVAILTPYNKSSKLPKQTDIARIKKLSPKSYTTQPHTQGRKASRPSHIEKTIKETAIRIAPICQSMGHIRAKLSGTNPEWEIELFNGAAPL